MFTCFTAQLCGEIEHFRRVLRVQCRGGFIEQQHAGTGNKGLRHEDELLLTARKRGHGTVGKVTDLHGVKRLIDPLENVGRHSPGKPAAEAEHDHFEDCQAALDLRELRQVSNSGPGECFPVFAERYAPGRSNEV